ncbi:hypothetical protein KEM56_005530 [Ascosphaera pollenicola]|nr:hypothetical protein KEM56_005530 [Ascosphaera pollenicola]
MLQSLSRIGSPIRSLKWTVARTAARSAGIGAVWPRNTRAISTSHPRCIPLSPSSWSYPPSVTDVANDDVSKLAASPRRPLTLTDLLRHGHPPLSEKDLLASANFTLSLLPKRLAYRINALRNLPFIIVSNPNVAQIYSNYLGSLSTLLPYQQRCITSIDEERVFVDVLSDLVQAHTNTIPLLARGFLECRKYISPSEVTKFLDEHLRARIGTRLIAQQHLALHYASRSEDREAAQNSIHTEQIDAPHEELSTYIGVIDTKLQPAKLIQSCADFVSEICELQYGVRPRLVIDGQPDAEFAHIPMHLEYIFTELLKNAFRATLESGNERESIEVTIAAAPDVPNQIIHERESRMTDTSKDDAYIDYRIGRDDPREAEAAVVSASNAGAENLFAPLTSPTQGITIRIRDRGGGIPPRILPHIWSYSFTTFTDNEDSDALDILSGTKSGGGSDGSSVNYGNASSIAGLGYGLPLSRAYAEYFGGSIQVQSLWGWGTDVYLTLRGVGMRD